MECLFLNGVPNLRDAAIQAIAAKNPNLQRLTINTCSLLTDAGICHLRSLVSLEQLTLGGCFRITDTSLRALATLENLTALDLASCKLLTNAGPPYPSRIHYNQIDVRHNGHQLMLIGIDLC
jgi:hypothetical protein